ncbi:thiamine-phosphate pyrophosphorylase [Nocardioides sp. J9]|uniref:thiamine phosphate synthase n=1 Tax=unclassified Nocardioides TaxID=2615069 RepID=UPI00048F2495|nr:MULTISPECIES: thiamine phosphate synthase [unclassified Nocardioides]TWG94635.1 thiamine-phosphate pyrophosphorylase [Nocardioides sp. J9]
MTAFRATPRLHCLVSDRDDHALLPVLAEAGVDGFQVRAKELGTRDLVALTRAVVAAVRPHGALVVVDDRVDVALAAGADGVHLGADDLAVADARGLAPRLLVGATCRTRTDVEAARADGADYAGLGPVFATTSKPGLPAPLGAGAVADATGVLPIIAIGGIDADGASAVRASGAHGVAVIGAIWRHRDPVAAAKELVAAVA